MHETHSHAGSSFVTLTYNEKNYTPSLEYSHFQDFMKRLRKQLGPTRFFVAGEYGEIHNRPHWHAILFGQTFPDRVKFNDQGLFTSAALSSLWPQGFSSVGSVTPASAGYVASYCTKKVTGPPADNYYSRLDLRTGELVTVTPEFAHMSLKPGLGRRFFDQHWREMYLARDGVHTGKGSIFEPPPRYYDKLLEAHAPDISSWRQYTRYVQSAQFADDCTPSRLFTREHVCKSKLKFNKHSKL